jgi:hypothetical protein
MTDEVPTSRPLQQRVGNQLDGWSRPCSIGIHCTSDDSASGSPRFSIGSITKSKATFCRSSCGRSDRELTRRSVTTRPAQPVSPKVREGRRPPLSRRGPESRQAAPISRLRRDAARASRVTASVPLNDGMHHHVPEAGTPPILERAGDHRDPLRWRDLEETPAPPPFHWRRPAQGRSNAFLPRHFESPASPH